MPAQLGFFFYFGTHMVCDTEQNMGKTLEIRFKWKYAITLCLVFVRNVGLLTTFTNDLLLFLC